jgi:hypothetical protein
LAARRSQRAAGNDLKRRAVVASRFRSRDFAFVLRFFGAIDSVRIEIAWVSAVRTFASELVG